MVTNSPPADTVSLTIDGQTVTAKKGTLLVEAAKLIGIDIPIFCYHPKLKPVGACRMCLVQVEKLPRLQTACTTPVGADMVVHTNTPEVIAAQNGVIELLLANHPLDCPICDKGGECPLQDNTFGYGLGVSRFTEEKRHKEKAYPLGERIVLDRERCIMCYRCVRFHQEIPGDEALAAVQRGADSEIAAPPGETYDSIFSGNTIELCPVGALTSRQYRFKARPWDLVRTPSVCNGCAVGCNIEVHSRTETVLRLVARENPAVDDGWLCDRGRFDTVPVAQAARPPRPMVRDHGALRPATWAEALARSAGFLGTGGGVLASASLSNEALWLLETHLQQVPAALWPPGDSSWPVQGAIASLAQCKSIVLVGLDVWNELPVLALWIRKAAQAGAKIVVLGERNGLWRSTSRWLELPATPETIAAHTTEITEFLAGGTPAALLAHPSLVPAAQAQLEALATSLGVNPATGMLGAPLLAANGRGAQDLAPRVVRGDVQRIVGAETILALGDESLAGVGTGSARLILATSQPIGADERVAVVLPMAHPYERQASITNLEGRVQLQEGGATPPPEARSDWGILAGLAQAWGISAPSRLDVIRSAMAQQRPELASIFEEEALVARV